MKTANRLAAICLLAVAVAGCSGMGMPSLCGEGPARDQRARAQYYDPYAQADYGPTVPEARPRDFDRPFAPPLQSQLERWSATRQQAGP